MGVFRVKDAKTKNKLSIKIMGMKINISNWQLHIMLLPAVIFVLIFSYIPMYGIIIAFQNFMPAKGLFGKQQWVGLEHFIYALKIPDTSLILRNTLFIAVFKIVLGLVVPITVAILLNEVTSKIFKKAFQTAVYLPYFISWVLLGGILKEILSPSGGLVNIIISAMGMEPIYFLGEPSVFPWTIIITDVWKGFGYGTIVYLAAITNVNPELYEAARIDGAKWLRQVWSVTLPAMLPIIILMATMSLGNVLNAGFDQIFVLYSPQVYSTGDIIDTYVYRMGLINAQYSFSTAVGLMKSIVSSTLIGVSYYLAYKFGDYRIF